VTNPSLGTGYTTSYTYNAADAGSGTVVKTVSTDPNGHATTFHAKDNGTITKAVDALSHSRSSSYTANNDPSTLTDGLSQITTLNYDTKNNLTSLIAPKTGASAATWSLAYNTPGTVTGGSYLQSSTTDPQGSCSAFTYDAAGNLTDTYAGQSSGCDGLTGGSHFNNSYQGDSGVSSCTSDGLTTTYKGILCSTSYPNQAGGSNKINYTYTFASTAPKTLQKLAVTQPGGTCSTPRKLCMTYSYDADTRLTSVQDSSSANGSTGTLTTYCYDGDDRITKVFYTAPSAPPNCITGTANLTYTYDGDGNLTQRVDSTGTATFGYDDLNRAVTKNTGTNVCSVTVTRSSGTVTLQGTVCFGYDGANNLTSTVDSLGTTTYGYDAANRLTSLVEPGGTSGCTIGTTKTLCTAFAYDNDDHRTQTQYPGGAKLKLTYDNAGNETSAIGTSSTGTTLTSFTACYRLLVSNSCPSAGAGTDVSVVQQVKEADPRATLTSDYGYDLNGRLCYTAATVGTCAAPPSGANTYSYDAAGNRNQSVIGSTTNYYLYNAANQLCAKSTSNTGTCAAPPTGATTYNYDGNGNLTGSANPTSSYSYNTAAQTTAITNNGVTLSAISYADVGQNERTSFTNGANTTTVLSTPLGVDKTVSGAATSYTVRDSDGALIGYRDSSGTHWYSLLDNHGSVVAVINSSGSTVGNRYAYDEYGRSTYTFPSPTVTQPYGYLGGYTDPTGLIKFGDRYYDPTLGRWTQPDPIAGTLQSPKTIDRYTYVGDDPNNNSDLTGRDFFSVFTTVDDIIEGSVDIGLSIGAGITIASGEFGLAGAIGLGILGVGFGVVGAAFLGYGIYEAVSGE
jgi:RHS repeat-associated protein